MKKILHFLVFISIFGCATTDSTESTLTFHEKSSKLISKRAVRNLKKLIKASGFKIIKILDYQREARKLGLNLGTYQVITFTHAARLSQVIQNNPTLGLDLPLKILLVQDDDGQSKILYNDPMELLARHSITSEVSKEHIQQISMEFEKIASQFSEMRK